VIATLAFRHLLVRKLRSLFLLAGFSLGVGVMIVLLSVGQAMLEQSRDASLVGGGEITVLPQGIDVEAMRTGGLGGMFFGIDRARFLVRQILGGERQRRLVRVVSPAIEGKLLYLRRGDRAIAVRAGGEIPSRAQAVGSGLDVRSGHWKDSGADSSYLAPTRQQLYDELDRFHVPASPDSSWGEWHYFNLLISPDEWWYITYLIAGKASLGQLLVTHRRTDGAYDRYVSQASSDQVAFDTTRADVSIGGSFVRQRSGTYRLRGLASGRTGQVSLDVNVTPAPNQYFPPVELRDEGFASGYVVPGLVAHGSGNICVGQRCSRFTDIPAYLDHNWGIWRDVTWEWGAARGSKLSLLYGGVYGPGRSGDAEASKISSPFFLTLVDSLGVEQVLRFGRIGYQGLRPASGVVAATSPKRFTIVANRESDTLRLEVRVVDALATEMGTGGFRRVFLQMRGRFSLSGRVLGQTVADSGTGFFETYVHKVGEAHLRGMRRLLK
jgi:hypothetical protein